MRNEKRIDRRTFLRQAVPALAGLGLGTLPLAGCDQGTGDAAENASSPARPSSAAARELNLTAAPGEVEVGAGRTYHTWLYNGQFPGPEIRVQEGERLRITVQNDLPSAGTTVHWHGVPVPNAMDGVPGVTQEPIPSGEAMTYEYEAAPAGTYMYHSHQILQLDRGLVGPLIIDERRPHVSYDREYTVVLDDFLPGEPQTLSELTDSGDDGGGGMMGGMMGRGRDSGMMSGERGTIVPPYEGLLINGKLPEDPAAFDVKRGERVRLRLINLSSAITYHVAIAGHRMNISHADALPVEPVEVDSLRISMGERYDVIVEADNPGAHTIMAAPVEGENPPARAILNYRGSRTNRPPEGEVPEGLQSGRRLRYRDLQTVDMPLGPGEPDRTFNLQLSGGMMMNPDIWAINRQTYPDAEPLEIREGERVRVNMTNMSMMLHPMHLHGHFFRVGNVMKETVLVEPHMGRASFEFVADNPGDWLFHCHNLYHMDAGMARIFTYI